MTMFKIKRYTFEENLVSFIILCVFVILGCTLWMMHSLFDAYEATTQPIQLWEYVGHAELPIPPFIEVENEVPTYTLAYVIEEPIALSNGKLTAKLGVFNGPSGKETYYNLPMEGVIKIMKDSGFYMDYEIREDGVKTYGGYVMLAADLNKYPRGTLLETSLGKGIVCDTGEFINTDVVVDIAVDW